MTNVEVTDNRRGLGGVVTTVMSMPESGRQANPPVGRQFPRLQNDNLGLTERRDLIRGLTDEGVSQAEIARELGVSRQAVQKMLAV